jgi:hypothetical protein
VLKELQPVATASVTTRLKDIWLSGRHGVVVIFEISGVPEISKAVWFAWPWGEIQVEK